MKTATATKNVYQVFADAARLVHSSPRRGVFVLAVDGNSFHSLIWSRYPISAMRGPIIPRLHINRFSSELLPYSVAKAWRVKRDAWFNTVDLEVTVLEAEIATLSSTLPALISHIELGHTSGFESRLPFPTWLTTSTNIWSLDACSLRNPIKAKPCNAAKKSSHRC